MEYAAQVVYKDDLCRSLVIVDESLIGRSIRHR